MKNEISKKPLACGEGCEKRFETHLYIQPRRGGIIMAIIMEEVMGVMARDDWMRVLFIRGKYSG